MNWAPLNLTSWKAAWNGRSRYQPGNNLETTSIRRPEGNLILKGYHRRSIRLKDYDYSQSGAYFVTICTRNRECFFGDIEDGGMVLSDVGKIVQSVWKALPNRFPSIGLDTHVMMPNHIHGIITVGEQFIAPNLNTMITNNKESFDKDVMNHAPTLGEILRTFKAISTRVVRKDNLNEFAWQRNYYEHIIRNEQSLNRIRQYIAENPLRWAHDKENPLNLLAD